MCPWARASSSPSGERQLDRERGGSPTVGDDPDPAVHALDELAADVEAEAGAPDAAREVGVEPEELLEDARLLPGRDPEALVLDADPGAVSRLAQQDPHAAAVRRVLDRVVDEVRQHLAQLARAGGGPA